MVDQLLVRFRFDVVCDGQTQSRHSIAEHATEPQRWTVHSPQIGTTVVTTVVAVAIMEVEVVAAVVDEVDEVGGVAIVGPLIDVVPDIIPTAAVAVVVIDVILPVDGDIVMVMADMAIIMDVVDEVVVDGQDHDNQRIALRLKQ